MRASDGTLHMPDQILDAINGVDAKLIFRAVAPPGQNIKVGTLRYACLSQGVLVAEHCLVPAEDL
ncbi:MAG: hypothetical protein VYE24_07205 [Acidobacteriota bacterium]|nr:hypothetical protein [Acidobacteriota bacterium]